MKPKKMKIMCTWHGDLRQESQLISPLGKGQPPRNSSSEAGLREHTSFVARRWVEQNRSVNESSQIASLIELLRAEAVPAALAQGSAPRADLANGPTDADRAQLKAELVKTDKLNSYWKSESGAELVTTLDAVAEHQKTEQREAAQGSAGLREALSAACNWIHIPEADEDFIWQRLREALAKEARDADFGSPKEIIAGLDHINAHNGSLGKLCFSIAALEPFQPNISPSYRDGYTAAKNAALALVEAVNEAARDAAKETK